MVVSAKLAKKFFCNQSTTRTKRTEEKTTVTGKKTQVAIDLKTPEKVKS